jgi:hypothetical protein
MFTSFKNGVKSIQTAFYNGARTVVHILVHSHFDLVSLPLAQKVTELVSEPVTQMALKLINNHLISLQQKR